VKAMNFLLPHIRRMPETLAREQFAADAAQKLGIGSSVLREELRHAALKRRERVESRPAALTEVERVLLRALANTDMEGAYGRHLAAEAIHKEPTWFEHLASFPALQALAGREARDPMEVVDEPAQKALLAEALLGETRPAEDGLVAETLAWLEASFLEQKLRQIRAQMTEAERSSGWQMALELNSTRSQVEKRLSELKAAGFREQG
jgi:DNA primase